MTTPSRKAAIIAVAALTASRIDAQYPYGQTVSEWIYDVYGATKKLEAAADEEKVDFVKLVDPIVELIGTVIAMSFDVVDKADTQALIHAALDEAFGEDKALALATLVARRNIQTRRMEIVGFGDEPLAHFEVNPRSSVLDEVVEKSLRSYGFRQLPLWLNPI